LLGDQEEHRDRNSVDRLPIERVEAQKNHGCGVRDSGRKMTAYTNPNGGQVKIRLRYPASPENARDHAQIAVALAREEYDAELDFSPESLDLADSLVDSLREDGLDGEDAAEMLFVFGCYLGEVLVRRLGGAWVPTVRSALRDVSPWPMVVALPSGSTWDAIGKAYRRLELGDSEYLPAFYEAAAGGGSGR
jgi:hypothetical protein